MIKINCVNHQVELWNRINNNSNYNNVLFGAEGLTLILLC